MIIKPIEDSVLTQKEKDDVVLGLLKEGGIFSKTPPTNVNEMKEFIEKYREEVTNLFDSYVGSESDKIREIPNIGKFFEQVIVPAVESLHSEGKLTQEKDTDITPHAATLPQPQTDAYKSYQTYGPKNSTATPTSPRSITGKGR